MRFSEYFYKGIDIYDPNEEAITKKCFISNEFDYDLTQNYRRYHIYQNETFKGVNNTVCNYSGYEGTMRQLLFTCDVKENGSYSIGLVPYELTNIYSKVENLVMKCAGDVENLNSNFGFLFFNFKFNRLPLPNRNSFDSGD